MHLPPLIQDLAVILGIAGLISLLFRKINQPVVLGYIIAGMLVGPYTPPVQLVTDIPSIQTWAELGVIFLMFSLGLEFSFRKLARVGMSAGITASSEVLFFLPGGFLVGKAFGWPTMDCIFLGATLAISSTTIIVKALDELKLKTKKFAELIFATLIVEDLIAILLIVGLTTFATGSSTSSGMEIPIALMKLILVVGGWFIVGYFVVPRFMKHVGKVGNGEMITLLSLGLCLGLVVFASRFHYSTALGAFIMGSILAESSLIHRIEERIEPLKDLFGAIFFVSIGMLIDPKILWQYKWIITILCLFTIAGKVLSTSLGAVLSGQTVQNSLRVGLGLAQIGEFSFIIAALGQSLKVTSDFLYPIGVAVSLVTTFTTPYMIKSSEPIAKWIDSHLPRKIHEFLRRYSYWIESRKAHAGSHSQSISNFLKWLLNAILVAIVFTVTSNAEVPILKTVVGWAVAVLVSSPFIWGMVSSFKKQAVSPLSFLFYTLTLALLAVLSLEFFILQYVLIGSALAFAAITGLLYKKLENYYHWFEKHFLSTFEEKQKSTSSDELGHLAPWDAHLVHLKIHPNAPVVKMRLQETQLRSKFGVNIVAIKRGLHTIISPKPEELLLPHDELVVLATDAQIDSVRPLLDFTAEEESQLTSGYELRKILLPQKSPFIGLSIRESSIREKYDSMVVGVERARTRMINPDSDLTFQAEDILWVVGHANDLDRLSQSTFK